MFLIFREFEVDSINFAGQTHRWRLSGLLQRGRDRRRDALLRDLALATRFLVVTAKARLISHCFSVSQSLKALITGLLRLLGRYLFKKLFVRIHITTILFNCNLTLLYIVLDIIIGVPSLQAHNLDAKIREERCRYLVAELVCRVNY